MKSRFVLAAPASGKSTLSAQNPGKIMDPEDVILFHDKRADFNHPLHLFFDRVLPCLMGALHNRMLTVCSLIEVESVAIVKDILIGLNELEYCDVVFWSVEDSTLTERVRSRQERTQKQLDTGFRNWPYTLGRHTLYHGIASRYGLKVVTGELGFVDEHDSVNVPTGLVSFRLEGTDESNEHVMTELLPHIWGEWISPKGKKEWELSYTFRARWTSPMSKHLVLTCRRESMRCARHVRHGTRCDINMVLDLHECELKPSWCDKVIVDVSHASYRKAICTEKLLDRELVAKKLKSPNPKFAVIAYLGTFAPIHMGHVGMAELAKKYLETEHGYTVLGGYIQPTGPWISPKASVEWPPRLGEWHHRAAMVQLMTLGHGWLMYDGHEGETCTLLDLEAWTAGNHVLHSLGRRVLEYYGLKNLVENLSVIWLNGNDAFFSNDFFPKLEQVTDECSISICVTSVKGRKGVWKKEETRKLVKIPLLLNSEEQKVEMSSSRIRSLVRDQRYDEARKCIGNHLVFAYLLWLYYCREKGIDSQSFFAYLKNVLRI